MAKCSWIALVLVGIIVSVGCVEVKRAETPADSATADIADTSAPDTAADLPPDQSAGDDLATDSAGPADQDAAQGSDGAPAQDTAAGDGDTATAPETDVSTDASTDAGTDANGPDSVGPGPVYGGLTEPCDGLTACPAGKVCDTASHACVACLVHSDCGAGALCIQQLCKKSAICKSDKDCKDLAQVCDMKAAACTDCVQQADCGTNELCVQGQCKASQACKSSKDCTAGICDLASAKCVDCVQSSDCDSGQFCIAGANLCANALCQGGSCGGDSWFACQADGSGYAAAKPCQDGNLCTADSCKGGGCVYLSTAATCQDANPCTADDCDPAKGCTHSPATSLCDDGLPCTQNGACKDGNCQGTTANCDDANACTEDSCAGKTGCVHTPIDAKSCNADDNPCTALDSCSKGVCTAGSPKVCAGQGPCSKASCDKTTGNCSYAAVAGSCDDANPCTNNDVCKEGVCAGGTAKSCDDKNPCTADTCDSKGDCSFAPSSGPCEDGNPCTAKDSCAAGGCVGQPIDAAKVCDDGNPCTGDTCSPVGGCTHLAKTGQSCSDGSDCTSGDSCGNDGKCQGGTSVCTCKTDADCATANGGNLCLGAGVCETTPGVGAKCVLKAGAAVKCDASKDGACAANTCVPSTGNCAMAPKNQGGPCDDGDSCTANDTCKDATCKGSAGASCTDNDECTIESCVAGKGCTTIGSTTCNDGNPCTIDYCKSPSGCATFQNIGACEDGDACTTGDFCSGNACKSGQAKDCDDKNDCTADSCDAKLGCLHAAVANKPCNDGDSCTSGDACSNGVCKGAASATCDDGNPCTKDTCGAKGCEATPLADGDSCGSGQVCKSGECVKFCLNDGMCPGGCICGSGTCAYPEWTMDGQYAFTPDEIVGYHPYFDEYWTIPMMLTQNKGTVQRFKPDGKSAGSFEFNASNYALYTVRQLIGDPKSSAFFIWSDKSSSPSEVVRFDEPGGMIKWSTTSDGLGSIGGIFIDDGKLWLLISLISNNYPNPILARNLLTGAHLQYERKLAMHTEFLGLPNTWNGKLLLGGIAANPSFVQTWQLANVVYNKQVEKFGLTTYKAITVRGDTVCLSAKGNSTCYAMAKVCK